MLHVTPPKWMKHLLVLALLLALPLSGFSWGPGGHMIVARIAYTRLNRTAKAQVDRLIKIKINPAGITSKSLNFVDAAHWADDLRDDHAFDFLKPRHFIDQPFTTDRTTLPSTLPGADTIVSALTDNLNKLKISTDDNERAMALRLVIHFVGDIHQPLHCATLVTQPNPTGDKGGNGFSIKLVAGKDPTTGKSKLKASNLHSYWDGGIGNFPKGGPPPTFTPPSQQSVSAAAVRITRKYPADQEEWEEGGPTAFEQWAAESEKLAQSTTYKHIQVNQVPTAGYNETGVAIVQRRVAWGGYRLAELLNSIWPEQR